MVVLAEILYSSILYKHVQTVNGDFRSTDFSGKPGGRLKNE